MRHLRYFMAVAEEGSFHRASQRLNVAQSALSRRILALEQDLGFQLLTRTAKGVTTSSHGDILAEHAQRILGEYDRAKAHMQRVATGATGVLRLGVNRVAPQLSIFSKALRGFRATHPEVELKIIPMPSKRQLDALLHFEIDLGLLSDIPSDSKDIEYRTLISDRFILVLPMGHRLAAAPRIFLRDLVDEDFVFFSKSAGSNAYDKLSSAFMAQAIKPRIVQEGHSEDAQLGLVVAGAGIAFTYSSIVERYHRDDLIFKPVEDLDVGIDIGLAWRRGDRSPLCRQLVDSIMKVTAARSA